MITISEDFAFRFLSIGKCSVFRCNFLFTLQM